MGGRQESSCIEILMQNEIPGFKFRFCQTKFPKHYPEIYVQQNLFASISMKKILFVYSLSPFFIGVVM